MSEPKQPMVMIVLAPAEDMKTMTPQKVLLLAQATMERSAYRNALTIVIPQLVVAFVMLSIGIGAHGALCGILLAGFLNAIVRLLLAWAARRTAVRL